MKKTLKIVLWTLGSLVALIIILIASLPLWLGTVARPSVNAAVPKLTKTSFNIGHLALNPYRGRFELGDLLIGNPAGYSEPVAVSVSNLVVDIDMSSVGTSVIHVEEITVEGVFLAYLHGGEHKVDNLTQIQYNLAGGKEKYEAKQAKAEAKKLEVEAKAKAKGEVKETKKTSQTIEEVTEKFMIDRLTLSGIRLKYEFITVPVPAITLTNLGKGSGGITAVELSVKLWEAILSSAAKTGDGISALGGLINTQAGKLTDSVKAIDFKGATSKSVDSLKGATSQGVDSLKGAGDAATKEMKKATDAVKKMFNF